MKITILGSGIIDVCTAWHLLQRGHEVTVVDRKAGHGTLGWPHGAGSGKALAELMSGQTPDLAFRFYGT
jgi:glycine/D-amino acid oxidase-like deaminating enzyme